MQKWPCTGDGQIELCEKFLSTFRGDISPASTVIGGFLFSFVCPFMSTLLPTFVPGVHFFAQARVRDLHLQIVDAVTFWSALKARFKRPTDHRTVCMTGARASDCYCGICVTRIYQVQLAYSGWYTQRKHGEFGALIFSSTLRLMLHLTC